MIIMSSFHVASSVVVASSALDGLLRLAAMVIVGVEWHGWLATIVTATGEWRIMGETRAPDALIPAGIALVLGNPGVAVGPQVIDGIVEPTMVEST